MRARVQRKGLRYETEREIGKKTVREKKVERIQTVHLHIKYWRDSKVHEAVNKNY